jgi:hypothetical protein
MKLPKGWPTEEMIEAGKNILANEDYPTHFICESELGPIFSAMLAAAPTPPAQEEIGHSNLFQWCAPGDRQKPVWILMFDDRDRGYNYYEVESDAIRDFNRAEDGGWNCRLFALMPRTPAQEAEPVARVRKMINSSFIDSTGCKGYWGDLPDGTPLYTRPANDELRQAAEEAEARLRLAGMIRTANMLRAALEGKS